MKRFLTAAVVAALAFSASVALATPINTAGLTLSSGGNTFSSFTCNITSGGALATPNNCGQIDATSSGGNLLLQSGFVAAGGSFDDALISYHVSATNPIDSVDLGFNGTFLGLAVSSVTETVHSGSLLGPVVGFLTVSCTPFATCDLQDPPFESPPDIPLTGKFTDLFVTKDIVVAAGEGLATISLITQSFHQVPEPASMAIFGSALVGIGLLRRRRKHQK